MLIVDTISTKRKTSILGDIIRSRSNTSGAYVTILFQCTKSVKIQNLQHVIREDDDKLSK